MNNDNKFILGDDVKKSINQLFQSQSQSMSPKYTHPSIYLNYIYNEYISPNLFLIIFVFIIIIFLAYRYQNKFENFDNPKKKKNAKKQKKQFKNEGFISPTRNRECKAVYDPELEEYMGRASFNPTVPVSKQISYTNYLPGEDHCDRPNQYFPHSYPNYGYNQNPGPEYNGVDPSITNNQYDPSPPFLYPTDFNATSDTFTDYMIDRNRNSVFSAGENYVNKNKDLIRHMLVNGDNVNNSDINLADFGNDIVEPPYTSNYFF